MTPTSEERLAAATESLAQSIRHQSAMTEVHIEAMPAAVEGRILGLNVCTVRANRKKRRNARLMGATA